MLSFLLGFYIHKWAVSWENQQCGFRTGPTQIRLYNYRSRLEAWNFRFRKKRKCTIRVAKTKALISFAVTAKLICVFVFAYAYCWFSHEAAHIFPFLTWILHTNVSLSDNRFSCLFCGLMSQSTIFQSCQNRATTFLALTRIMGSWCVSLSDSVPVWSKPPISWSVV